MPLVRKMFRGGKVWAEVDDQGELVAQGGHTKIRYREEDTRTYSAKVQDVEEIDESRLNKPGKSTANRSAASAKTGAGAASEDAADHQPPGTVVIFTDGACFGNPGPAGTGGLLEWRDKRKEFSTYLGEGTNNIAELSAIQQGLSMVTRRSLRIRLYTDSAYAIGVLTKGWKVQENRELVTEIRQLMTEFSDLKLIKVKGHSGDPRNERADQLARDGIDNKGEEPAPRQG